MIEIQLFLQCIVVLTLDLFLSGGIQPVQGWRGILLGISVTFIFIFSREICSPVISAINVSSYISDHSSCQCGLQRDFFSSQR